MAVNYNYLRLTDSQLWLNPTFCTKVNCDSIYVFVHRHLRKMEEMNYKYVFNQTFEPFEMVLNLNSYHNFNHISIVKRQNPFPKHSCPSTAVSLEDTVVTIIQQGTVSPFEHESDWNIEKVGGGQEKLEISVIVLEVTTMY